MGADDQDKTLRDVAADVLKIAKGGSVVA